MIMLCKLLARFTKGSSDEHYSGSAGTPLLTQLGSTSLVSTTDHSARTNDQVEDLRILDHDPDVTSISIGRSVDRESLSGRFV